ncbi:MAG: TRAP transporter small permease [Thermoguttaceae bacterium]|jgi:TRAP-type C4-dicarboxylate transport system permease small subunit|nr:TRAP transporter small permease [Thermoguttaceae bacterium]
MNVIPRLSEFCAQLLRWLLVVLFALLFLDVLWGVFSRYVLGHQARWSEEVAIYLLIWVSLLGAAHVFREKGHLGFDYLVARFDESARRWAAIAAVLICALFIVYVFLFGGVNLMLRSLQGGQVTPALGWRVGYLYGVIPLSGVFFLVFAMEQLWNLLHGRPTPGESAREPDKVDS